MGKFKTPQKVVVYPPPELFTPLDRVRWYRDWMVRKQETRDHPDKAIVQIGPEEVIDQLDFQVALLGAFLGHKHYKEIDEALEAHCENVPHRYADGSTY